MACGVSLRLPLVSFACSTGVPLSWSHWSNPHPPQPPISRCSQRRQHMFHIICSQDMQSMPFAKPCRLSFWIHARGVSPRFCTRSACRGVRPAGPPPLVLLRGGFDHLAESNSGRTSPGPRPEHHREDVTAGRQPSGVQGEVPVQVSLEVRRKQRKPKDEEVEWWGRRQGEAAPRSAVRRRVLRRLRAISAARASAFEW
jgi:hypothetical protein